MFYVFAAVVLLGAGVTCFARDLMRAAMGLLAVLAGVAGFYCRLHAEFLGAVQLALVGGAMMTAVMVGIVLTRKTRLRQAERPQRAVLRWGEIFLAVFAGVLLAGGLIIMMCEANWARGTGGVGVGSVGDLGALMLTKGSMLLVILLAVVLGTVLLGAAYMLRTRRMIEPPEPDLHRIAAAPEMGRRI